MRKVIFLGALLAATALPGCSSLGALFGPATLGWHIDVGTPSTVTVPATAVVNQGSGAVTAMSVPAAYVGAGASGPVLAQLAAAPASCGTAAPATFAAAAPAQPGCTIEDVCRKLDLISNRLPAPPPARPLPSGPN